MLGYLAAFVHLTGNLANGHGHFFGCAGHRFYIVAGFFHRRLHRMQALIILDRSACQPFGFYAKLARCILHLCDDGADLLIKRVG